MKNLFLAMVAVVTSFVSCTTAQMGTRDKPIAQQGVRMTVASEKKACTGVGKMECMMVKENNATEWSLFYSGIEGFNYQPGFEYVLLVEKIPVANPPADGSSIKYRLLKEVKKEWKRTTAK